MDDEWCAVCDEPTSCCDCSALWRGRGPDYAPAPLTPERLAASLASPILDERGQEDYCRTYGHPDRGDGTCGICGDRVRPRVRRL